MEHQHKSSTPIMGKKKQRSVDSYFQKSEPANALIKKVYNSPLVGQAKNFNKKRASHLLKPKPKIEPDLSEFEQRMSPPVIQEDLANSLPTLPISIYSPPRQSSSKRFSKQCPPQPP